MKRDITRQVVIILAVIGMLVVNGLANTLPLNGKLTGDISDQFKVFFVPAGYVFSIWGLIYIALIAFAVYQALPSHAAHPGLRSIGYWFALSCLANMSWLFLWHYERFVLTMIAMLVLLASLIIIYLRLSIGRVKTAPLEKWCIHVPFSIYLGWITVATIANATDLLYDLNWDGGGIAPEIWAVIMLAAGLVIAVLMSVTRRDAAFLLVLIWAYIGIAVKQAGSAPVAKTAWAVSGVIAVLLIGSVLAGIRKSVKTKAQKAV